MGKKVKTAITPTREEDYAQWYQEVVKASDMSENSPVRGCMVIKPWGFAIWENIQRQMDDLFKEFDNIYELECLSYTCPQHLSAISYAAPGARKPKHPAHRACRRGAASCSQ